MLRLQAVRALQSKLVYRRFRGKGVPWPSQLAAKAHHTGRGFDSGSTAT